MHYSPAFWVAISFFVFIVFAWSFIRKAFLNTINQYRNSISSAFSEISAKKAESEKLLSLSIEKLDESGTNHYVLNAHKTAKQISDSSEAKLALLKQHMHSGGTSAIHAFQGFVYSKMKQGIIQQSSVVVENYITKHEEEFNIIAIKQTIKSFEK